MSHANLCQQCASKRQTIVQRTGHYEHGARCDACRRLTKTAICHAVACLCDANNAHLIQPTLDNEVQIS